MCGAGLFTEAQTATTHLAVPGFGRSSGYPVWYREQHLQRFNAREVIDFFRSLYERKLRGNFGLY